MAAFRLPSALMLIISLLALTANILSVYIGPYDYKGSLTYIYQEGDDQVVSISFSFDAEISEKLLVLNPPSPWVYTRTATSFTFTGGSLSSGESLVIPVSFKEYMEPGNRSMTVTSNTSRGEQETSEGFLQVTEMILLKILYILGENKIPILALTMVSFAIEAYLSTRKKQGGILETSITPTGEGSGEFEVATTPSAVVKNILDREMPDNYPDVPEDAPPGLEVEDPTHSIEFVVYVVSDLHLGSHIKYRVQKINRSSHPDGSTTDVVEKTWFFDKSESNLFDEAQVDRFLRWLDYVENDIETNHPSSECHIVINGDFLDLWQASVRRHFGEFDAESGSLEYFPRFYCNRLDWMLDEKIIRIEGRIIQENGQVKKERESFVVGDNPNHKVVEGLLRFASRPNRKLFYIVGNHDDPLYTGRMESDEGFGFRTPDADSLRDYLTNKLGKTSHKMGLPEETMSSFYIGRYYLNKEWGVYAEHGHVYDGHNWRKRDERVGGQGFVESALTEMQESGVGSFSMVPTEPYDHSIKYLRCEREEAELNPDDPRSKKVNSLISRFVEEGAESLGYGFAEEIIPTNWILEYLAWSKYNKEAFDEEDEEYFTNSKALAGLFGASIVTFGHTHRPVFREYSPYSSYFNTAEFIYNIEFTRSKTPPRCRLTKNTDAADFFLKIAPWFNPAERIANERAGMSTDEDSLKAELFKFYRDGSISLYVMDKVKVKNIT